MKALKLFFNSLLLAVLAGAMGAGVAELFGAAPEQIAATFGATFLLVASANGFAAATGFNPAGQLFSGFITAGSEYNGEENEKIIFREAVNNRIEEEVGIKIHYTKSLSLKLNFLARLSKILMPYASGFQGGRAAAFQQKKMVLEEFKAEQKHEKNDYKGLIQERAVDMSGRSMNDISGTDVFNAQRAMFTEQLADDIHRVFWLGDTDKTHQSAGTYPDETTTYAVGDPDKYYNVVDGIIKSIMGQASNTPTTDQIQRVTITSQTLAADAAENYFRAMYDAMPRPVKKLKRKKKLWIYATESLIENYRKTLEDDGTEAARTMKINGVERMTYRGIPIRELDIEDDIANDFASSMSLHWCIWTTPENLALVLNAAGPASQTKFWFNPDDNENRQRAQFHMGADFVLPELMVVAYYHT